jgi:hypothetical protein
MYLTYIAYWLNENWLVITLVLVYLAMAVVTRPDKSKERDER